MTRVWASWPTIAEGCTPPSNTGVHLSACTLHAKQNPALASRQFVGRIALPFRPC